MNSCRKRFVAAVTSVLLVAAMSLVGAGGTAAAAESRSTLTFVSDTQISTFNPFLAYYDGELDLLGNIYPTLMRIDKHGNPAPYLATKWTSSPDKLTWTFTIRKGLKWSDGKPITAKDVAWTFNLIMHNDVAATANGSLVTYFDKVTAPSPTKVVIHTSRPQANMLYVSVPVRGIPIVPKHIWKSRVDNLQNVRNMRFPVVGYGPWTLTGYKKNQYATLQANDSFFMGPPRYDRLVARHITNSDAGVVALRNGALTVNGKITPTQYRSLTKNPDIQTYQQAPSSWVGLEINPGARTRSGKNIGTGNPVLGDNSVRTAIAYAMNRKALVKKVLDGLGKPGTSYLPPAYPRWYWEPSPSEKITYKPDKANQILDKAGYATGPDGVRHDPDTGKPLSFRLGIHSNSTADSQIAPYVEEWLKAIGIKLTVNSMSFSQLNDNLSKGDWDILMDAWSPGPDPTYMMSIQTCQTLPKEDGTGGNTESFYCNKQFDNLFKKQLAQFDPAERTKTVQRMEKMLYEANTDIILYYLNGLGALRKNDMTNYLYGSSDGQGVFPEQHLFYNWRHAEPTASDGGSTNTGLWIGIGVAVVVVLGVAGFVVVRRRRTAMDRE